MKSFIKTKLRDWTGLPIIMEFWRAINITLVIYGNHGIHIQISITAFANETLF